MTPRSANSSPSPEAARIVAGARAHFFAHGFRGVTMSDLARELGMSKKTLYAHFESKAALLAAVIEDKLGSVERAIDAIMDRPGVAFATRLEQVLTGMRAQTAEVQPAFVRDVRLEEPTLFARIQEGRGKMIHRHFGRLLEEGRKAGTVRKDIPIPMLIEILVGAVDAVVVPARMMEMGLTPQIGLTQVVSVFLEGVLVRKVAKK